MRALWLAGLLLLPLLPSGAHAQVPVSPDGVRSTLSIAANDPGHPMKPGKNESIEIIVNYLVDNGGVGTPAPDPNDPPGVQKTHVTFTAKKLPSWVLNVSFDPPQLNLTPSSGASQNAHGIANAILVIDPRAPALDKQELVITGTAEKNGNIAGSSSDSPPINIKPAFIAKANVTAPASFIVPGGRWTELPFTVKNLGNGEARVKLNVTARPQNSQVEYPTSITLARDASQVVNVRVRVPWTGAELGAVELEALPLSDDDSGKAVHADIEVIGQSAVPGASAFGLLSVMGIASLLRRR